MSSLTITVKWNKESYDNVVVSPADFATLSAVFADKTSVPPERQKWMLKGLGLLKDDAKFAEAVATGKLANGGQLMLMGTADANFAKMKAVAAVTKEQTVFAEDLDEDDARRVAAMGGGMQKEMPPGLENLGNTCYFNSTFQMLAAVPQLRDRLVELPGDISPEAESAATALALAQFNNLRADGEGGAAAPAARRGPTPAQVDAMLAQASQKFGHESDKNVALSFRNLVREVRGSTRASLNPFALLTFFRMAYPQFAARGESGVPMQQDAEEAYTQLTGALNRAMPGNAMAEMFGYQLESRRQLKGATVDALMDQSVEKRTETAEVLRCHIGKDTNFLVEGLKDAFSEDLELNNQIFEKHSKISKLPRYAMVQFVRFFWKAGQAGPAMGLVHDLKQGSEGRKAKILRPVEFPKKLDLFSLCTDELQESLKPGRVALQAADDAEIFGDKSEAVSAASKAAAEAAFLSEHGNVTGEYELFAVVSHKGRSAESGHYVAWVKDDSQASLPGATKKGAKGENNDAWLLFDDDKVSQVRWEPDIKQLSGKGGGDWHIAYFCLYRSRNPTSLGASTSTTTADGETVMKDA